MGAKRKPTQQTILNFSELKQQKIQEIRREAERVGQAGVNIYGSVDPLMVFHMAVTPEDVALLQQANLVAKTEADILGIPVESAEIKEKWYEAGEEKTRLHPEVPIAVHDAVLGQAILHAKNIYRKQEVLIQAVQDAGTPEEVEQITWDGGEMNG